jgi:hypothetical protein
LGGDIGLDIASWGAQSLRYHHGPTDHSRGWATIGLVTLENGERVTIDGNVENFYELMSVLRERTGIAKSYFNV